MVQLLHQQALLERPAHLYLRQDTAILIQPQRHLRDKLHQLVCQGRAIMCAIQPH